ncbi:hypothetical protein BaRGS_00004450 [Batillaria attramentaria]|uniref:Uncharacterized protein n=1 Tax=Batillaria attramentaria TaxID=370345 RepID=A0ABD0LXC5_9CAEN
MDGCVWLNHYNRCTQRDGITISMSKQQILLPQNNNGRQMYYVIFLRRQRYPKEKVHGFCLHFRRTPERIAPPAKLTSSKGSESNAFSYPRWLTVAGFPPKLMWQASCSPLRVIYGRLTCKSLGRPLRYLFASVPK